MKDFNIFDIDGNLKDSVNEIVVGKTAISIIKRRDSNDSIDVRILHNITERPGLCGAESWIWITDVPLIDRDMFRAYHQLDSRTLPYGGIYYVVLSIAKELFKKEHPLFYPFVSWIVKENNNLGEVFSNLSRVYVTTSPFFFTDVEDMGVTFTLKLRNSGSVLIMTVNTEEWEYSKVFRLLNDDDIFDANYRKPFPQFTRKHMNRVRRAITTLDPIQYEVKFN